MRRASPSGRSSATLCLSVSLLPPHFTPATRIRRICAGFVNFISGGLALAVGNAVASQTFQPGQVDTRSRLWALGFIGALCLICVFKKKSLGSLVCLLEIRQQNGEAPTFRQMLLRSAPVFLLAVFWCFPIELLPTWVAFAWAPVLTALIFATVVSGSWGLVTGASLLDRFSKTMVLQLRLPDDAKPGAFGARVT